MNPAVSTLSSSSSFTAVPLPKSLSLSAPSSPSFTNRFLAPELYRRGGAIIIRACSLPAVPHASPKTSPLLNPKNYAGAAVILAAAAAASFSFAGKPARAEPSPETLTQQSSALEEETQQETLPASDQASQPSSPLSDLLESNPESVHSLKQLLEKKLENGEDKEALKILQQLVAAQPTDVQWKFLSARLLSVMGDTQSARDLFEEILAGDPLSFEALFENALLMDRCGEGEAVIKRLEEALRIAQEENKVKEARDVKLIMAQVQFLQKNVEDALKSYQELTTEDPNDFRPYFCQGMIYSLMDRNEEAREQFAKYRELSPKKFEVEGFLRTPLSRMKLFGTDETN